MQRSKILLAACIRKVIRFSSVERKDAYLSELKRAAKMFRINSVEEMLDGFIVLDVEEQYNKNQLPVRLSRQTKG